MQLIKNTPTSTTLLVGYFFRHHCVVVWNSAPAPTVTFYRHIPVSRQCVLCDLSRVVSPTTPLSSSYPTTRRILFTIGHAIIKWTHVSTFTNVVYGFLQMAHVSIDPVRERQEMFRQSKEFHVSTFTWACRKQQLECCLNVQHKSMT